MAQLHCHVHTGATGSAATEQVELLTFGLAQVDEVEQPRSDEVDWRGSRGCSVHAPDQLAQAEFPLDIRLGLHRKTRVLHPPPTENYPHTNSTTSITTTMQSLRKSRTVEIKAQRNHKAMTQPYYLLEIVSAKHRQEWGYQRRR